MRQVIVFAYERKEGDANYTKVEDGKGRASFHAWGCDYEEFESGPGNYSTAIVERANGIIENVPADMVRFVIEGDE